MANLTRYDPFSVSPLDSFDDVLNGFFRPVSLLRENSQPRSRWMYAKMKTATSCTPKSQA
jgi:hypothetical protein